MVVHAATGSLITFATLFWGFWALRLKGIHVNQRIINHNNNPNLTPITKPGDVGSGLHDYPAIATAMMAVPLLVTGFIPFFRRW